MGASFLTVLGRSQWVASSDDDFVRVACDLASDAARLSRWRAQQRGQMEASALMDELGFAKRFLSGVKQAWSLGQ
jgi:predicted O-linked N-acetylglucosamine transferase (SPINDLY family)